MPHYPEDALELAKEFGEIGWFTAEEIEDYIKGKGVLVDMAMEGLGFRRDKKDVTKWARMTTDEKRDFQYGQLTSMMADRNYRLYGSPVVPRTSMSVKDLWTLGLAKMYSQNMVVRILLKPEVVV